MEETKLKSADSTNLTWFEGQKGEGQAIAFASREAYLEWRGKWRIEYKALAKAIREMKLRRKTFIYKGRTRDFQGVKLPNPLFKGTAADELLSLKDMAHGMMQQRQAIREEYNAKRKAQKEIKVLTSTFCW